MCVHPKAYTFLKALLVSKVPLAFVQTLFSTKTGFCPRKLELKKQWRNLLRKKVLGRFEIRATSSSSLPWLASFFLFTHCIFVDTSTGYFD